MVFISTFLSLESSDMAPHNNAAGRCSLSMAAGGSQVCSVFPAPPVCLGSPLGVPADEGGAEGTGSRPAEMVWARLRAPARRRAAVNGRARLRWFVWAALRAPATEAGLQERASSGPAGFPGSPSSARRRRRAGSKGVGSLVSGCPSRAPADGGAAVPGPATPAILSALR
jgi:hypothetical protein